MHKNAFKIQNITVRLRLLWTSSITLQLTFFRLFSTFISRQLLQPGNYLKLPQGKNFLVITSTFLSIWFYFRKDSLNFLEGFNEALLDLRAASSPGRQAYGLCCGVIRRCQGTDSTPDMFLLHHTVKWHQQMFVRFLWWLFWLLASEAG